MSALPPQPQPQPAPLALWHLALAQPQLLGEHLAGYAALVSGEAVASAAELRRRALLLLAGCSCLLLGLGLAGVALLLWAALPVGSLNQPWLLVAVPLLPLAAAAFALRSLRGSLPLPLWQSLRRQWAADAALLHSHGQ